MALHDAASRERPKMSDIARKYGPAHAASSGSGISHLRGMGMGMGPGEGAHPYRTQTHLVYGEPLIDRHEWRHTVFLVEFLMQTNWQAEIHIPHYPGDNSDQTKDELQDLRVKRDHEGRAERTEEIIAEIFDYVGLYENRCYFDAHSHPTTSDLVWTMDLIGWTVAQYYKEVFGRKRPSQLDPSIRPIIRVPTFSAYPSGHSTQSHLINFALQDVLGARIDEPSPNLPAVTLREELDSITRRIGENREWAGVHYRSDTEAGRTLARSIWALIERNANFARVTEQARAEWQPDRAVQSGYKFLGH
jgi:hypothetical protein